MFAEMVIASTKAMMVMKYGMQNCYREKPYLSFSLETSFLNYFSNHWINTLTHRWNTNELVNVQIHHSLKSCDTLIGSNSLFEYHYIHI